VIAPRPCFRKLSTKTLQTKIELQKQIVFE
jgi:hypothetical protein